MAKKTKQMFTVDVAGLRSVLERRGGKAHALLELIQNGFDADGVTQVSVNLWRDPGSRMVRVTVEDDSPAGFANLSDAYTMFRKSTKVADVSKRGMFNLGEKLVIALMNGGATVTSTKGQVVFDPARNTRTETSAKTEAGSVFSGALTMNREEQVECEHKIRSVLPPLGIKFSLNGEEIRYRRPRSVVEAKHLPCVVWNEEEERLKETKRNTTVSIVEVGPDEEPYLYVLGLPVMPLYEGQAFHYDIGHRVPTNLERSSVRKSVMRRVNALCLEVLAEELGEEDAKAVWVRDALEDAETLTPETVKAYVEARHGPIGRLAVHSPSDKEASNRAVAAGYQLLHGGHLPKAVWEVVRSHDLVGQASVLTPSHRIYGSPDGVDVEVRFEDMNEEERWVAAYTEALGRQLLSVNVNTRIVADHTAEGRKYAAAYNDRSHTLTLNRNRLGRKWFKEVCACFMAGQHHGRSVELLIHEFAHEAVSNHLSDKFHDECCRIGAAFVGLVMDPLRWRTFREDVLTQVGVKS